MLCPEILWKPKKKMCGAYLSCIRSLISSHTRQYTYLNKLDSSENKQQEHAWELRQKLSFHRCFSCFAVQTFYRHFTVQLFSSKMNFTFLHQQQSLLETSPCCAITQLTIQSFVCEGQSSGISNILLLFAEVFPVLRGDKCPLCFQFLFLSGVRGMTLWSRCPEEVVGLL